jgi:hypothetical protein
MLGGAIWPEASIPVLSCDRHLKVRTCLAQRHDRSSSSSAV